MLPEEIGPRIVRRLRVERPTLKQRKKERELIKLKTLRNRRRAELRSRPEKRWTEKIPNTTERKRESLLCARSWGAESRRSSSSI